MPETTGSTATTAGKHVPLGPNFRAACGAGSGGSGSEPPSIRLTAPETPTSDALSELSLAVQPPPLRLVPPGHESCVTWEDVRDDPTSVAVGCEDEYGQERTTNVAEAGKGASDDVTLVDPSEAAIDMASKEVDLQSLINKCLRLSVKHTRVASRDARLLGLQSLRGQQARPAGLTACASSNFESDDEDLDLEDEDDEDKEEDDPQHVVAS